MVGGDEDLVPIKNYKVIEKGNLLPYKHLSKGESLVSFKYCKVRKGRNFVTLQILQGNKERKCIYKKLKVKA